MASGYERPDWAGPGTQNSLERRLININVQEFIRTRDALTSSYIGLASALQRAVQAYLEHTNVVLEADGTLQVSHLLAPFSNLQNPAFMAQMALQQQNGGSPAVKPEEVDKKKRKKRAYKPRDLNAPKRPLTAYFRYLGEVRPSVSKEIAENPQKYKDIAGKPGDISRIATERWNQLTEDQQRPYKQAYQDELKNYETKMTQYKATGLKQDEGAKVPTAEAEDATVATEATEEAEEDEKEKESSDDDSSDDDAESDDDEEASPPTPAPPKAATPKKSAMKKGKTTTTAPAVQPPSFSSIQTPVFSSINNASDATAAAPSSSPTRKRKGESVEADGAKKSKRGRKSKADDEVVAGSDSVAPVAQMTATSPEAASATAETSGKKKKDKKKKKGDA
ncbi:hypothetical protein LTR37_001961 [Vermiconidia calcicola]|uniref:Uncharacterized protein n=1 Tax=Vermiconidia calcicola TaxID=1690605 RepID=A0ACC3NVM9_9PEZI|nr:hypothetical protein LTR37_001961 [Vermiconidia calcicola]